MQRILLVALLSVMLSLAYADTRSASMQFTATINKGCFLGSGASDISDFGTINFGDIDLTQKDVTSTSTAGSILVRCTPGTTGTIALNAGLHSNDLTTGRNLQHETKNTTLMYQLYSESTYTTIWGDGTHGILVNLSPTGNTQPDEYKIYARLFAISTVPPAGLYKDTVTVTMTYQ